MNPLPTSDSSKYLFHYTSREVALEHILSERRIRLSVYKKTNDPLETKWAFSMTGSNPRIPANDFMDTHREAYDLAEEYLEASRALCLTMDDAQLNHETPLELRGYCLSRMWAQYGRNHTGVCLAFDADKLKAAIFDSGLDTNFLSGDCVTYKILEYADADNPGAHELDHNELSETGVDIGIRKHILRHHKRLFFTKTKDWEGEREYRWVYTPQIQEPERYISIENALVSIFFGVKTHRVYQPTIREVCAEWPNINVYQMRSWAGQFDAHELNYSQQ